MKTLSLIVLTAVLLISANAQAGKRRIDISPAALVSLNEGHSGAYMGGAVSVDIYATRGFAMRTTIGYTKDRYFPANLDYDLADYNFWASFAPYVEVPIGGGLLNPYVAFLGTVIASGGNAPAVRVPHQFSQAPVGQLGYDNGRFTSYSLGLTVGTKVPIASPVSVFAEVTHYFYTNVTDLESASSASSQLFGRSLDFERNPTYLSLGLTYSLNLFKD